MTRGLADQRTLAEIGRAFIEVALRPDGDWDLPLRRLADVTGANQAQLMGLSLVGKGLDTVLLDHTTDQRAGVYDDYFAIGADNPEVHWKAGMRSSPLRVVGDREYAEVSSTRGPKDPFTEFLQDYGGYFGCHATLLDHPDAYFVVGTLRSNAKGHIAADELANFAGVLPYIHAATLMQRSLEHQGALVTGQTLEAMRASAFVLDRNGVVRAKTSAAEALILTQQTLACKLGRLHALRREDDRKLQSAIEAALKGAIVDRIILGNAADPSHFQACEVFALPRREWSFGFEPRLIVTVRSPNDLWGSEHRILMSELGLSKAEAEVALLVADGATREGIAQRRGTSVATVREQLKSIFAKVNVQREGALISLINRLLR